MLGGPDIEIQSAVLAIPQMAGKCRKKNEQILHPVYLLNRYIRSVFHCLLSKRFGPCNPQVFFNWFSNRAGSFFDVLNFHHISKTGRWALHTECTDGTVSTIVPCWSLYVLETVFLQIGIKWKLNLSPTFTRFPLPVQKPEKS